MALNFHAENKHKVNFPVECFHQSFLPVFSSVT